MAKIEHKTLNDRAYDEIKGSLVAGEFHPGQVLILRSLAENYGISTTPVREALQRLVGERQLVMLSNRSIAVPDWDADKFVELFRIRCALEGLAGELAATRISAKGIRSLDNLVADIGDVLLEGRLDKYVGLNQRFHFTIYEQSNSPRLLEIIRDLWGEAGAYMNQLFSRPGFDKISNDEHKLIVEALKEGSPADVRNHVVADITKAAEFLMPHITELAKANATR